MQGNGNFYFIIFCLFSDWIFTQKPYFIYDFVKCLNHNKQRGSKSKKETLFREGTQPRPIEHRRKQSSFIGNMQHLNTKKR